MPRWRGLCEPLITPADWRVEEVAPEAAMPLALVASELPLLSIGVYGSPPALKREKGGWYSKYPDPDPKNDGQQTRYDTYLQRQAAEREYEETPEHYESVEEQEAALEAGDKQREAEKNYREQPIGSSVVDEVFARFLDEEQSTDGFLDKLGRRRAKVKPMQPKKEPFEGMMRLAFFDDDRWPWEVRYSDPNNSGKYTPVQGAFSVHVGCMSIADSWLNARAPAWLQGGSAIRVRLNKQKTWDGLFIEEQVDPHVQLKYNALEIYCAPSTGLTPKEWHTYGPKEEETTRWWQGEGTDGGPPSGYMREGAFLCLLYHVEDGAVKVLPYSTAVFPSGIKALLQPQEELHAQITKERKEWKWKPSEDSRREHLIRATEARIDGMFTHFGKSAQTRIDAMKSSEFKDSSKKRPLGMAMAQKEQLQRLIKRVLRLGCVQGGFGFSDAAAIVANKAFDLTAAGNADRIKLFTEEGGYGMLSFSKDPYGKQEVRNYLHVYTDDDYKTFKDELQKAYDAL
jgi:hypothetical protein